MSKSEILAELPKLSPGDRSAILEQLWLMEEATPVSDCEKTLLNEAQDRYEANPSAGAPWSEVQARLRKRT